MSLHFLCDAEVYLLLVVELKKRQEIFTRVGQIVASTSIPTRPPFRVACLSSSEFYRRTRWLASLKVGFEFCACHRVLSEEIDRGTAILMRLLIRRALNLTQKRVLTAFRTALPFRETTFLELEPYFCFEQCCSKTAKKGCTLNLMSNPVA